MFIYLFVCLEKYISFLRSYFWLLVSSLCSLLWIISFRGFLQHISMIFTIWPFFCEILLPKEFFHEFPGSCYIKVDWEKYALFPFSILKISSSFIGYEAAYFHIRGNILYGSFHYICNITPFTYFLFKIRRWRGSKPAQITCRDTFAHSFHHNLIAFIRQALSFQLNSKFLWKRTK